MFRKRYDDFTIAVSFMLLTICFETTFTNKWNYIKYCIYTDIILYTTIVCNGIKKIIIIRCIYSYLDYINMKIVDTFFPLV